MEENKENIENEELFENVRLNNNNNILIIGIIIGVVAVLIIAGLVLFKTGLFGNKDATGYYELYEMTTEDTSYSREDLESLKKLGLKVSLELRNDKTGTINLFGKTMEVTFDKKNLTIDGDNAPYKVENDKLSMEYQNEKLVFQKATKTENNEK